VAEEKIMAPSCVPCFDETMTTETRPPIGWVVYVERCGLCSRWVPFWAPTLAPLGLTVTPQQAPWVASRLALAPESVLTDILLLFNDGRKLAGADVYRYVMRRLWWANPLYLLSIGPGLRQLFDLGYRVFADNRSRITAVCGLRPPGPDP
jgi:predicted DCC family thiol-disulfide oxidoreductase YuxK